MAKRQSILSAAKGPACTICTHESRHLIDVALACTTPMPAIAQRFGVSKDALQRHRANHLSPAQRAAILTARKPTEIDLDQLKVTEGENLLGSLVASRARLLSYGEQAAQLGDLKASIAAENAIASNLTIVGKLLGTLVQIHDVRHTNILVSADYLKVRSVILHTLENFPEARIAIASALAAMENDAAKEIIAQKTAAKQPLTIEHEPAAPKQFPPCPLPMPK